MKAQSELLTEFYRAYLAWVEAGAEDRKPFSRATGLCGNLQRFCVNQGLDDEEIYPLLEEQGDIFIFEGLYSIYPFETNIAYEIASERRAHHLNPIRLQWVRDHANFED